MRVLVTGASGQVGMALLRRAPAGIEVSGANHAMLDIGDPEAVARKVGKYAPDLIVNAAAYTAVDRAESERELAFRINAEGPGHLARAARSIHARLIHISTDFVFDGNATQPYQPSAPTNPLGVYGASKWRGEQEVLDASAAALVLRTAWVYAPEGKNFLLTMLRLMNSSGSVRVVNDQVGTPTAAISIADAIWRIAVAPEVQGIHHWTDDGIATWYDFAVEIARIGAECGLVRKGVTVTPISTAEYPTPARRPSYSVLDKNSLAMLGIASMPWRMRLHEVMMEIPRA